MEACAAVGLPLIDIDGGNYKLPLDPLIDLGHRTNSIPATPATPPRTTPPTTSKTQRPTRSSSSFGSFTPASPMSSSCSSIQRRRRSSASPLQPPQELETLRVGLASDISTVKVEVRERYGALLLNGAYKTITGETHQCETPRVVSYLAELQLPRRDVLRLGKKGDYFLAHLEYAATADMLRDLLPCLLDPEKPGLFEGMRICVWPVGV